MREILRTNDPVIVSVVGTLFEGARIQNLVLDQNMSVLEGSLGILPRRVLVAETQVLRARQLLRDSASVLDASYEVGLSGPGRLHDLFVTHESMSPDEWKSGGEGLTISFGLHPSPFGKALIMATGTNAQLLAMSGKRNPYPGKLGVIEEGAFADVLLVDGNPLADLTLIAEPTKNFVLIMKDGTIYKNTLPK